MAKKPEEIDDAFIARRPQDSELSVPAVFDERRIRHDLQRLAATPSLFGKYVAVLRSRFTKSREIALLNQWANFYQSAKQTVEARTDLDRALYENSQLTREYHIKDREKDLRLTELEAEIAEAELRAKRAKYANRELDESTRQGSSPYASSATANDPQRVERWYKQARQGILGDHSLSVDEQDRALADLKAEYDRQRRGYIDI
jgi:hypothetical protein